jgi:putative ABC transport system permease protein
MTFTHLAVAGVRHYRRTHVAVVLGVAAATAVLAGSLLVGTSVRASLASIATSRLGHTSILIAAEQPFTEALSQRVATATSRATAPLIAVTGVVTHASSSRRAGGVQVYGIDDRFFAFHGVTPAPLAGSDVLVSPDLAAELGAVSGDALVVRVSRPTDIPIDSLHGRREDVGRSIRLTSRGTLAPGQMGQFSLASGQGPSRSVFVPLARLQRDLELRGRVNTLLVAGHEDAADVRRALDEAVTNEDLGLRVTALTESNALAVESAAGLVPDDTAAAVATAADRAGRQTTPVLSWLANRMSVGDKQVPYSLVTAVGANAGGDTDIAAALATAGASPPIVLNAWTANALSARPGASLELEYYRWSQEGQLVTERAMFRVAAVVPMRGMAIDRRLAPDYPGITNASSVSNWDPPFPIDLKRVRPQDEAYWDQYRAAPKAFIPLEAGQKLWASRYGRLTSIRVAGTEPLDFRPPRTSIAATALRSQRVTASAGATDFGAYFSYFSFFLMVAALLLAALFFRLSIEQRASQIGVLRAGGFPVTSVRRALVLEGAIVAIAGAVIGVALAIAWAAFMMFALRTWWVGAVGTTLLTLHVDPLALAIGAVSAAVAGLLSIALTVRSLSRLTPRALLTGASDAGAPPRRGWSRALAPITLAAAVLLSAASAAGVIPAAGGFFGAGALVLIGGLAAFRLWLAGPERWRRSEPASPKPWRRRVLSSRTALGLRNAAWRPGRSLTAAGLVASAVFLLVAVDSFRKNAGDSTARTSGTGGFALIAESTLPVVHDLQSKEGRETLGVDAPLDRVSIFSLRLRPGDDASCLNLYQPKQPRLVGVPPALAADGRFRFAKVVDDARLRQGSGEAGSARQGSGEARSGQGSDAAGQNPWRLLESTAPSEPVPAIVDQTSLQYVLHAAVGDTITIDADTARPIDLRIVASLDDSVLQGEILIGDRAFQRLFPDIAGYRVFLIDAGQGEAAEGVGQELERALEPFGFDAQSTRARLDAFHRVENTYLSTFQALGGLGLVLGCFGLVAVIARNVLERRRELALLGAAGFTGADLQKVVAIEHLLIVGVGLAIGLAAAGVAIAPVVMSRTGAAPWNALVWVVPVALAGVVASFGATRSLRRLPLVASLRSE